MSAVIAYNNLVDDATLSGAATIVTGFPLANVQTRQLSTTARIATSGTPEIIVDFGAQKAIKLISLLGCNVNFGTANTTTVQYRPGTSGAWTTVAVTWPTDPVVSRAGLSKDAAPALHCVIESGIPNARQVRIQCGWGRLDGAAYYEIGRLWAGDALVLPAGVDGGWASGFDDPGKLDISAGLQAYESQRARPRTMRLSLSGLAALDAFGFSETANTAVERASLQGLQMYAGCTGEIIVLPRTSTSLWMRRIGIYGHLAQTFDIQHQAGPNYSAELSVVEER